MRRSVRLYGSRGLGFACLALIVAAGATLPAQQQIVPGNNVNMVSGTKFPEGDPYLQRQNEPSSAVSTRNPLHILGGANDYRTVDIPHPSDQLRTQRMNADAWVGLFKSLDGGQNWNSTLLPGYPQDPAHTAPLWGYHAATDPFIRAGTNGMFYYAGLAFNRGDNAPSAIFVARYMDMNNLEAGDPIVHLSTTIVDSDPGTRFLDKTALATDIPRTAATCSFNVPLGDKDSTVVPQTIPAGNVYLAYSVFTGSGATEQSVILFTRSTDCGTTWSTPKVVSTGSRRVQNAQIAVDPATGYVYVSWRRFRYSSQDDAVMVVRSTNGGVTFGKVVRVAGVVPFDQPTKETSFRSNGFQTMAVDGTGRVYLAWTQRGQATLRPSPVDGDARIVISTSTNGTTWTVPRAIQPGGLGHQLMPSLTFHAGRLRLLYYDLREDVSQVFAPFVDEFNVLEANSTVRHTMDVFVAQANPGVAPVFTAARLSDYAFGFLPESDVAQRLQFNPPNLPLFRLGTTPFMGDYIDLAPAPAYVQNPNGSWSHNTAPSTSATSHAFWTDNRDVRPPRDGDWTKYAPPRSAEVGTISRYDPSVTMPGCIPGNEGMRNQNIYTARVTEGLFVSSPGNNKPLGTLQRAFVVVAENATGLVRSFRLTIDNQPVGGEASFLQFSPLPTLDVSVPPYSSVARTVFASSSDERARVNVSLVEITAPGGALVPGGLAGAVVLNADPSPASPRLQNPRLQNPRLQNPLIAEAEAYNAGITNAVFAVPRLQNPRLQNPSIENPRLQNDSLGNPRLQNDAVANAGVVSVGAPSSDIENPRLQNPRLQNPRLQNQTLDDANFIDTSWAITNDGNTTAAYTINLVLNEPIPAGFASQLLIHKITTTPASIDCNLAEQIHTVLVANIPDPEFVPFSDVANPRLQNPRLQNPTLALAPGESATVTLRIVDPDRFDEVTYDATGAVTPAAAAQSVNTEDVVIDANGVPGGTPSVAVPLTITTTALPPAAPGAPYTRSLQTLASLGTLTCSVVSGTLPPGVNLSSDGTIAGTPAVPGNYRFTVRCVDANGNEDDQQLFIQIEPPVPAGFDAAWNGADTDWANPDNWSPRGVPQAADRVYIPASIAVVPTLTRNEIIRDLVVEPGATVDTNGFSLTITHNADAGRTIIGTGTTVLTGDGGVATGVFSNLDVRGRITLNGSVTVTGQLTLAAGARLNLNGQSLIVGGQLTTDVTTGAAPVVTGPATTFIVGGVLVNGLVLENAPLTIDSSTGGALTQFDNVRFGTFAPAAVQLTVSHPGLPASFAMNGISFVTTPTTGRLVQANDTSDGANTLIVDIVRAVPADGSAATATAGGAVVNWISDPDDANLAVTQTVSPIPVAAGTPLTYVITVVNGGPATATGVTLNPGVPIGATNVTASPTQGACALGAGGLSCDLTSIVAGAQVVVTVSFIPPGAGTLVTTASVTGSGQDSSTGNNTHTIAATVVAAGAGVSLTLGKTGSAASVAINTPFTYGLTVTNTGLTAANGVIVVDPVPAGLSLSNVTASQGTCSIAAGQVVCVVGTVTAGGSATITLAAMASVAGLVTNAASVTSNELELTPADNFAVVQTMVLATAACTVPTFTGPVSYQGSPGPTALVRLVDMNHDGHPDALATHEINGGGVDVFLNDGTGQFAPPRFTSTVTGPWIHAVADFNGDTHPDVVSSSDGTSGNPISLRLLTNDGTGTLTLVPSFSIPFGGHFDAVDIDRDGDQDLVIAGQTGVELLRNDGAANFAAPVTILPGGGVPAFGDFNGDNRTDVAVAIGTPGYVVLLGDGAGGFLPPAAHASAGGAHALGAPADLNGDGQLDLLILGGDDEEPSGQTFVALGDGSGGFGAPVQVAEGSFIYFPTLTDVNGDGRPDLVAISGFSTFEVRLGDGAGGFLPAVQFPNAIYYGPAVGDLNNDGRPDLVIGDRSGQLNVFFNNCGGAPANLGVGVAESADPVNEGDELTYTVTLTNHADTVATGVRLRSVLSPEASDDPEEPNVEVLATTSSAGGTLTTASRSTFTWTLPTLAGNSTATFEFRLRPLGGATLAFTTGVTSDGAETDSSDNAASETTTIAVVGRAIEVTNTDDNGPGSLRRAINLSNSDQGDVDRIVFNIGGGGRQTIVPASALPAVQEPAIIDGTTQPGFDGAPIIELNGNGLSANGLVIGGNTTVRGLVINQFGQSGIFVSSGGGGNVIEGNYIGLDLTGSAARPNGQQGVLILSPNNRLGGPTPAARNIISGNSGNGVGISGAPATGNIVQGNYVGTNANGAAAVPNRGFEGISIVDAPGNSILGNVVSGNASHGVQLFGGASVANLVQGNFIGTDPTGMSRIANAFIGVQVWSAVDTVIGGPGAARNIISGNGSGIEIRTGATGTRVENNYIGINAAGTAAISNGTGISINDAASANTIGGTSAGAGNVISGNTSSGVSVTVNAQFNLIQGNRIGTDANGIAAVPNATGVVVDAPNTTVGGTNTLARNVLSGNAGYGVSFTANSLESVAQGNYIGTNIAGTGAIPNGLSGVNLNNALDVTVGGTAAGAGNVISGNLFNGIFVLGSIGDLIQGNFIGTTATGTAALANGNHGISINSSDGITIGGTAAGARNVISGNTFEGVSIGTGSEGHTIQGNLIGTDSSGTAALGNRRGIMSAAEDTVIGGTAAAARNVISGNAIEGVLLTGVGTDGSLVQGNFIGTDLAGTAAIPNLSHGVSLSDAASARVGGTQAGAGNSIRNNGGAGIAVTGALARDNAIQGNSLASNGGLGIDLGANGVTPNDAGDGDTGANTLQNFPTLSSAASSGSAISVQGTLNSTPNTTFTVELFSAAADPSGFGEGAQFLNRFSVTTDGTGAATFTTEVPSAGVTSLTATATDPTGNTSEFSANRAVASGPQTFTVSNLNDGGDGSLRQAIQSANAAVNTADTIAFSVGGSILLHTALPMITDSVIIDGTTAPGFAGQPIVEVDGSLLPDPYGFHITAGNSTVRGLVISGFGALAGSTNGIGIVLENLGNNVVEGNYIGTSLTGQVAKGNFAYGVFMDSGANRIGGLTAAARNVISGNLGSGIGLSGASNNVIAGNYIGLDRTGTADLGNNIYGIVVGFGSSNILGGTTASARNIISGNNLDGINLSGANGNTIQGNYIGTNAAGTASVGNGQHGLNIQGQNNTIGGSASGAGNVVSGNNQFGVNVGFGSNNSIVGNLIGVNASGLAALGNTIHGINVAAFGTSTTIQQNVISGNAGTGVVLNANANSTILQANFIGAASDGTTLIPNSVHGVSISSSSNTIGRTIAGGGTGNVIAGNVLHGIAVAGPGSSNNTILGNSIFSNGTLGIDLGNNGVTPNDINDVDLGGNNLQNFPVLTSAVLGSTLAVSGTLNSVTGRPYVVEYFRSASCDPAGFGEGQVFVGQTVIGATGQPTTPFGGSFPAAGLAAGQSITATATSSDGTSEFSGCLLVTAGPQSFAVTTTNDSGPGSLRQAILDANASVGTLDTIEFNISGSGPHSIALQSALPIITDPVTIDGTTEPDFSGTPVVELDGTTAGIAANGIWLRTQSSTIRGLVLNRFGTGGESPNGAGGAGIVIETFGNNLVEGNYIGTDVTGAQARPNRSDGIWIDSAANRIGGSTVALRNVISGNGRHGILVSGTAGHQNNIIGNYIGVDAAGTGDLGNAEQGALVMGPDNVVGLGNVISGNGGSGVWLLGSNASGNVVAGNLIGVNHLGTAIIGNATDGVTVGIGAGNIIGGGSATERNVISGNGRTGVLIEGAGASANSVAGNYIGTDVTGTADLGNTFDGVFVAVPGNMVGGSLAAQGNLISGNGRAGVYLGGLDSAGNNSVLHNAIGVAADGSSSLPNLYGVFIESTGNAIGSAQGGNLIARNTLAGIDVRGSGNVITANRIEANGGLGIDLGGDGVTANDTDDPDAGANGLQNYPVLGNAALSATQLDFQATLNTVAGRAYTVEYFRSAACDSSGFGEGAVPFGVTTTGVFDNPTAVIPVSFAVGTFAVGEFITATATSVEGTSEFSGCLQIPAAVAQADVSITKTDSADPIVRNTPFTYTLTVHNAGPSAATGVFVSDALPSGMTASQAISTRGDCGIEGESVSCLIGALATSESVTITLTVSAGTAGLNTNTAEVIADQIDPNALNNTVTETTLVQAAAACPAPTFSGPTVYSAGLTSIQLAAGDLNKDGATDLVASNGASSTVNLLLANGTGGFLAPTPITVAADANSGASRVTIVDVNHDDNLDLVVTNSAPRTITVALGNGAGAFTHAFTSAALTNPPGRVETADFNEDGHLDLLVPHSPNVMMLLGDGTGAFGPPTATAVPDLPVAGLSVGHFSPDTHVDILIGSTGSSNVLVYTGDGLGGFTNVVQIPTSAAARIAAAGDINGDGRTDVLLEDLFQGGHVTAILGTPGGFLANQTEVGTGISVFQLADVTGDSHLDLIATATASDDPLQILIGTGTGSFSAPVTVAAGPPPRASGDFNADGRIDVAGRIGGSAGNTIAVFLNACGQPETDLSVDLAEAADPVQEGAPLVYTATVTNHGTIAASDVRLFSLFDQGGVDATVTSSEPSCSMVSNERFLCALGALAAGATRVIEFTATAVAAGTIKAAASVAAAQADPDSANNTDSETTVVNAAGRNIVVTNTNASGPGSLAQAIEDSNQDTNDVDHIIFDIPGTGPFTIGPTNVLTLTQPVVLDATTQPGFAGTPVVELNGTTLGSIPSILAEGLVITGGSTTVRGLVINRFNSNAIRIQGPGGNVVEGNFIGTDVSGTAASPNGGSGVSISNSSGNRIGGTTTAQRNLLAGNVTDGVRILGALSIQNVVQGNYIGLDRNGSLAIPNNVGVFLGGAAVNNTIGGIVAGAGNVIAGNAAFGVLVQAGPNAIQGNVIGLNAGGNVDRGNGQDGVRVNNSPNVLIGGTDPGARNVISGNETTGITLFGAATLNSVIQGNYIGTRLDGNAAIGNSQSGILVMNGANGNRIGGTTPGAGNVISGNTVAGVQLVGVSNTLVQGNRIGTDPLSTTAVGNASNGVEITDGSANTIGGDSDLARNIISGNGGNGVGISTFGGGAAGNIVGSNFIGTNGSGTSAIRNVLNGIQIVGVANTQIGGSGNVISGNGQNGIRIIGPNVTGTQIRGNWIGTNVFGNAPVENFFDGIRLDSAGGVVIGTSVPADRNVIGGNAQHGIGLYGGSSAITIQGNTIGGPGSPVNTGNALEGIQINTASNNTIGGVSANEGNIISFNGRAGITLFSGTGNAIVGNSIVSNNSLGIDFANDLVTANDAGDADTGANQQQNFPILTPAAGGVTGSLNSTPNTTFRIEFFANASCDASGNGEGQTFLGAFPSITTGPDGNAVIPFRAADAGGPFITATATDPANNTSEFSACVTAGDGGPVAHAGPDQLVTPGAIVALNGNGSSDPDSDPLTFLWSFVARPSGSGATLSAPTSATPVFITDAPGTYTVQLVVNDGTQNSLPDLVEIRTNSPPVASAGLDRIVPRASLVQLDGSASIDPESTSLAYHWTLSAKPLGSSATLSNPDIVNPTFTADRPGTYSLGLVVNDGLVNSSADVVQITTANQVPIASAGLDQNDVAIGAAITLSATQSIDPDGDPLIYAWEFVFRPALSAAVLVGADTASTTFAADRPGLYRIKLSVTDSIATTTDEVDVTTVVPPPGEQASAGTAAVSFYNPARIPGPDGTDVAGASVSFYNPATIPGPGNSVATGTASITYYNPAQIPSPSGVLVADQTSVSYYNPAAAPTPPGASVAAIASVSYNNPPVAMPVEAPIQESAAMIAPDRRTRVERFR